MLTCLASALHAQRSTGETQHDQRRRHRGRADRPTWSIVLARAGFSVALWDQFPLYTTQALTFIADRLPELRAAGLLHDEPETVMARIHPMQSLWNWARCYLCAGTRSGTHRCQNRRVDRTGAGGETRHHPGLLLIRHSRQRLHRPPADPVALPDRASGQSALSGAAGRDLARDSEALINRARSHGRAIGEFAQKLFCRRRCRGRACASSACCTA